MPKKGYKQTEEHKEKHSLSKMREKNPNYKKNFTEETRKKMSISHIGVLTGIPKSKEHRKKLSEIKKISQKKKWQNKEYREKQLNAIFKGFEIRPNKPEKLMINLIKKNNLPFNYVGDGEIWFRGENHSFNPDFLSKNPKHIIEVFGDYWHSREDMKKRDVERLKTYKKYGYKTLVIWQHELKFPIQVLNKVNKFIKGL